MEIVVRALVIFFFLWLVTRAVGRSTLGELSTFELLLYVTMGDLVQQSVTQQDYSLTGGMLAVGTFALLTVALSWLQWRLPTIRPVVTGRPVMVFADGRPLEDGMRDTSEIEYAVLEADGRISFFTRRGDTEGAPEKPPQG